MTELRDRILGYLDAADTYAQQLREERMKRQPDRETVTRLAADAGAGRKSAEVVALVRIGDLLELLTGHTTVNLERIGDVLDIPCRVSAPLEFTGAGEPR